MINVNLNLYGAFRQLGVAKINLTLPDEPTVLDLRKALELYLEKADKKISNTLIDASVFATDENILNDKDRITTGQNLAILPPVCGG